MYRKVQISVPLNEFHTLMQPAILPAPQKRLLFTFVTTGLWQLLSSWLTTHRLGFASFCVYINGNMYHIFFGVWLLLLFKHYYLWNSSMLLHTVVMFSFLLCRFLLWIYHNLNFFILRLMMAIYMDFRAAMNILVHV